MKSWKTICWSVVILVCVGITILFLSLGIIGITATPIITNATGQIVNTSECAVQCWAGGDGLSSCSGSGNITIQFYMNDQPESNFTWSIPVPMYFCLAGCCELYQEENTPIYFVIHEGIVQYFSCSSVYRPGYNDPSTFMELLFGITGSVAILGGVVVMVVVALRYRNRGPEDEGLINA